MKGNYMHAGALWAFAAKLAKRYEEAERDETPERQPAALSVLLFSAMAVESFLNELAMVALRHAAEEPLAAAVAGALDEAEDSRGSIRLKLWVATIALGQPIEKGAEPYQSFDLLFKVRDHIVHLKPHRQTVTAEGVEMEPKTLLKLLHARKLIADPTSLPARSFLEILTSASMCAWAVRSAATVVRHVADLIPDSKLGEEVRFYVAEVKV
jgi:hypothetical protein